MGRIPWSSPLLPGSTLSIGGKDVEVDSILSKADFLACKTSVIEQISEPHPVLPEKATQRPKPPSKLTTIAQTRPVEKTVNAAVLQTKASRGRFKNPLLIDTTVTKRSTSQPIARHDPNAPRAIVMKRPKNVPKDKMVVDVVVDPLLTKHLREHQREGTKFMYECVMGMRDFDGEGAILADEMGLGKTLQTIALLWTLLKQNPIYEEEPVIKKALIVCPVTLINNWRKEFRKWLGNDRIGVFVADNTKTRLTDFTMGKSYSVMIIGYEKLRTVQDELKKGPGIDIVIADEGHRLKTAQNKSAQAIKSLNTTKRIILSGTPIQNDLGEFFMMVDFVNPCLLGSLKTFTKSFEAPILKSRQPAALPKDLEKGEASSEELASLTAPFILRRTAEILSKYLPPKTEFVLLCRPTGAQSCVYKHVLASPVFQSAFGSPETSLQLITILKKVCNSPFLLSGKSITNPDQPVNPFTASLLSSIPSKLLRTNASSTKLRVLDQLLHTLRTTTSEKVVLVSNFTSTLDLLSTLLTSLSYPFLRLDGSTPSTKRQELVDTFNRTPAATCFAFLLSAKSGGMGINLIGASRLVLFDVDWNPATDLQAMARIHRDGQKRPCVIYRFLMAGGLDEKIWQRQVTKLGLAKSVMETSGKGGASSFSREELRDLFRLDEGEKCQTHELIRCKCGGKGFSDLPITSNKPTERRDYNGDSEAGEEDFPDVGTLIKASQLDMEVQERHIREGVRSRSGHKGKGRVGDKADMQSLMTYSHIDTSKFATEPNEDMEALVRDEVLLDVLKDEGNRISFLFAKTTGRELGVSE